MRTSQEILDSIENRLRQLNEEIKALNAARSALDGRDAQSAPRPRRNAATRTRPASRNGSSTEAPAEPVREASGEAPPEPARPSRSPTRRPPRRKTARATEIVPAGRLELLLSENGGMTTSALAERASGKRDQVLTLLRELEAAGRVRRTGQRRATRWHPITDEDRIRARAAELEARRKRTA